MAIEIKDLTVQFKNGVKAVNHVNLSIGDGIYGLLGKNGAGKTTLMRVLTTVLEPTSGEVTVNHVKLEPKNYNEIKQIIGYLPQELGLYPNITIRETLEYMGSLSGLSKKVCQKQIDYFLEVTSLSDNQNKKNRQLSGGMKRRVGLIQAMLHNPRVLIVDEPTAGLDPEERICIRNLLASFSKDRTVVFSTHVIEDLAATCSNLGILKNGCLLYDGNINALLAEAKNNVWLAKIKDEQEFQKYQNQYKVTSKQYKEDGIEVRFISYIQPSASSIQAEVTLEDAYIYKMHKDALK